MSDVKRYIAVGEFTDAANSKAMPFQAAYATVVLASDYDTLAQRCRELEGELQNAAFRQQSDESAYSAVAKQNDTLRAEVEILRRDRDACIEVANRNAEDAMSLRAEVERLRKDAARLQWLADNMRLMSGHKDTGHYQLPTLCDWVESGREFCTLDDLRAALDAMPEAL